MVKTFPPVSWNFLNSIEEFPEYRDSEGVCEWDSASGSFDSARFSAATNSKIRRMHNCK